jgi:hypothetical protein
MSVSIPSVALLAKAILCLGKGEPLPSSITDALRELCPEPVAEPIAAEPIAAEPVAVATPEQVTPVKEKKVRKISKAVAAEAPAAAAPVVVAPVVVAPVVAPVVAMETNDWRKHPSRLQTIDSTRCTGRRLDTKNPLKGTREEEGGKGMIFPERQCTKKPSPGSKLCAGCATKDTEYKADPSKNNAGWQGRLDEEILYPRAKIVGSELFLKRYPKGIPTASSPATAPAPPAVAPAVTTKTKTKKSAVAETVAADVPPAEALWKSFQHEGRTHIRNLKNNKVYFANLSANSPEENAVKEQYVGRWADDHVELIGDSDEDDE